MNRQIYQLKIEKIERKIATTADAKLTTDPGNNETVGDRNNYRSSIDKAKGQSSNKMSKIVPNSEKKTNHFKIKTRGIDKDMGFRRGACNLPSETTAMQRTNAPIVRKQKTPIVNVLKNKQRR